MGEVRSGTGRAGAQALPLTRRQQKRTRQPQGQSPRQPARQQNQQRPTQPPQVPQVPQVPQLRQAQPRQPLQQKGPERPATTSARPAAQAPSPAQLAPEPAASKPAKSKRSTGTPRLKRNVQAPVPAPAAEAVPAKPAKVTRLRAKTDAPPPAPARRAASAARTLKTAASAASGRKYPTLARMVAAAPRPELDASVPAADEVDDADDALAEAPTVAFERDNVRTPELLVTQAVPTPALADLPHTSARRAVPTRRLTSTDRQPQTHAEAHRDFVTDGPGAGDSAPHAASVSGVRPLPLPEADLIVPVAAAHACLAAVAALTGAGMLILGTGYTLWPFTLAVVVGAGGWLGYLLAGRAHRLAALPLLLAQLGALAWLLALFGARGAILALVPALALLALRWLGRAAAYGVALAALALYVLVALLQLDGALAAPVPVSAGGAALLDGGFVTVGLLAMLALVSGMHRRQLRAETVARARQHEARTLRVRLSHLRAQVEDDAARLEGALARVLSGRGASLPVETDGLLSPLAETTNAAAERLATLQRDREDRLRLEGAVRTVTRAVERAWLGLPWSWPEWSGTALDELVALLRTPRPQETRADWSDETPTLTAIPSIERAGERGMTPRPWERPTPVSMPVKTVRAAWSQALNGTTGASDANGTSGHRPVLYPVPPTTGALAPSAQLPWHEWDTWREWNEWTAVAHDEEP